MAITLDELQINIEVNSLKAQANIDTLAKSLRDAGRSTDGLKRVAMELQSMGSASASSSTKVRETATAIQQVGATADTTNPAIRSTSKELKTMANSSAKTTSKLGELFSSFKRIAMYRALRSAIKAITTAFSEGIKNLVEWDAAFGDNTSGALATMTEIKSLALQVKNTLGAMAMPIIQALLPALRLAAQALMFIANLINQVVRAFQGYSTYIKAVYKEVDYLGDSLGNAGAKAKELQRILFGFDDLNVLPSDNKRGGSGGTGALGNLNDMFEEVEINSTLKGIMDDIDYWLGPLFTKDFWGEIWNDITFWFAPLFNGETWKGIYNDIVYWFGEAWNKVKEVWGKFKKKIIDPITEAFSTAWKYIQTYFVNPINGFFDALVGSIKAVVDFIIHPSKWNKAGWEEMTSEIKQLWTDTFDEIEREQEEFLAQQAVKKFVEKRREEFSKLPPVGISTSFKVPTNGNNVHREAKYALAKMDPLGYKAEVTPLMNLDPTRKAAQTKTNNLTPIKYKSSVSDITNQSTVRANAQNSVNKLAAIGYKSTLYNPTNKATVRTDAQTYVNKLSPVAYKTSLNAVTGLVTGVRTSGQASASKLTPITFTTALSTWNLPNILANVWEKLQQSLNGNPLTLGTAVGTSTLTASQTANSKYRISSIKMADGGLVPNVGSLFVAGEAGAEVVANLGSHTGVMNVNQMQEAVAAGNIDVINAIYTMANMVVNAVNSKDLDVYMDSAKVGQSVSNYQNNQARRGVAY